MNYVSLLGRLTKEPELQYTGTGKAYLRFNVAVQREINREEADFISCVAWEKRAEIISEYFSKGDRILIQGRFMTSTYEKNGEKRFNTDVLVNQIGFIERKTDDNTKTSEKSKKEVADAEIIEEDDFPF
ncbi:single-stranded DNA-binding protein [Streptobacillus moniliformis]|uniref:single-stranded DNA-binding protein n=1 Tax=Streptobacillus moniliformis TaxID=34105 RepID=UPI0007E4841B|nr:single-stranded DNA-binding protein [Streptobacillus moniliformis]